MLEITPGVAFGWGFDAAVGEGVIDAVGLGLALGQFLSAVCAFIVAKQTKLSGRQPPIHEGVPFPSNVSPHVETSLWEK